MLSRVLRTSSFPGNAPAANVSAESFTTLLGQAPADRLRSNAEALKLRGDSISDYLHVVELIQLSSALPSKIEKALLRPLHSLKHKIPTGQLAQTKAHHLTYSEQDLEVPPNSYSLGISHENQREYRYYHVELTARLPTMVHMQGPLRDVGILKNGELQYGQIHVVGNNPWLFHVARNVLRNDPTMHSIFLMLEDGVPPYRNVLTREYVELAYPLSTTIQTTTKLMSASQVQAQKIGVLIALLQDDPQKGFALFQADPKNRVKWNTQMGEFVAPDKAIQELSIAPLILLAHELKHRFHSFTDLNAMKTRLLTPATHALNLEELNATQHEASVAKKLGTLGRPAYKGAPIFVKSIFDTEPTRFPRLQKTISAALQRFMEKNDRGGNFMQASRVAIDVASTGPAWNIYARMQLQATPTHRRQRMYNQGLQQHMKEMGNAEHEKPPSH
jgi:hypothetical protein